MKTNFDMMPRRESRLQRLRNQPAMVQHLTKTLDQEHAGEVRQVRFLEGKLDFSQGFWHWTQTYLLGRFVSNAYLPFYPSSAPSENQMFGRTFISQIAHH